MAIQIANVGVVDKIERLASMMGVTKTAAVEVAVDCLLDQAARAGEAERRRGRWRSVLDQVDRMPDAGAAREPLDWDENGLPA